MEQHVIRKHIYFSGRVQGVGFRYRSYYLARELSLTGWVRNLWDHRVEMEIQGRESDISRMVDQLQNGSMIHITELDEEELPPDEGEKVFRIAD